MHLLNQQNIPPSFIRSRITVIFAGVAGLSLCGLLTCFSLRKHLQQAQIDDEAKERRHTEQLNVLRRSLSNSQAEMGEIKKSLTVCMEEIERLKKRLAQSERDLDGMEKQNRTLADQTRNLSAQNQKLEGELKKTKAEQRDSIELLRIRTAELKGAQAFLTKADILSGAEVIKLVDALNGEIMQTSAVMAEAFTIEEKKLEGKDGESEEMSKVYVRAGEIVGYRMAELLRTSEHHEDPILVQMGLQTAMAGYTHWVISSWCFESPEDERMLSEVYARVRETGQYNLQGTKKTN
jgi:small-conductance mechanosensitive channel